MARKLTDQQRKKRKLEARSNFILGRYPALIDEYMWAVAGKPLPKNRAQPPDWVREAYLATTRTSFAPMVSRDPLKPGNATFGNLVQLTGMIGSELGAFVEPPEPLKTAAIEEKEFAPYLRRLMKGAEKQIMPQLKQYGQAMEKLGKLLVPADTKQFQENLANLHEGATALMTGDGEFTKGRSVTAQLYMALWFFWPHLVFADSAKEMHPALREFTGLNFSLKLVEKVCTELGVFKGRVGRPRAKKFLQSAKGV